VPPLTGASSMVTPLPRELDLVSMWQRIEGGNNAQPQRLVDAFVGRALFYG
jgi:hypothetical protein